MRWVFGWIVGLMMMITAAFASPIITIDIPKNTTYNTCDLNLNWDIDTNIYDAKYSLNGASNITEMWIDDTPTAYSGDSWNWQYWYDKDWDSYAYTTSGTKYTSEEQTINYLPADRTIDYEYKYSVGAAGNSIKIYCWDYITTSWTLLDTNTATGTHTETKTLSGDCLYDSAPSYKYAVKCEMIHTTGASHSKMPKCYEGWGKEPIPNSEDIKITAHEGANNITLWVNDTNSDINQTTIYFTVFLFGLNVSVFDNSTGNPLTDWTINITNSTSNYSSTNQNNPGYYNWSDIPYGDINITISDGSDTKYYFNTTTSVTNNESNYHELDISLDPKPDNTITITSSSGISLYDADTTTISCSAAEGSPQVSINSINVSIPYTLTVAEGLYVVVCEIDAETESYRPTNETTTITVNPLVACTNNNTFAFKKTITPESNLTTLNFTDVVPTHYMKSDLSDVYVPGANNTWINFTDGYYVIVNNTGMSSIDVYFGNYFANRTYSTHALSDNVSLIEGHTQINPAAVYTLRDELNGEEMFPPGATRTSIIQCSQGESYIPINGNDTKFLIASNDYITKALLRVSYTADSYYSRQFYPSEQDMLLLNFYLADAYVNAIDRIDFKMLDSDQYSSKLQAYKTVADTSVVITEGYFDVSRYYSAYLLEDSDYYLRTVEADGTITEYGRITVVEPAVKEIGLASMQLNPESVLIAKKITMNAWANDERTSLYVVYEDLMNQTNDLNITVYHENGTVFQNEHYVDTNSVTLEYNITEFSNDTFTVSFSVEHDTFGNSPVTYFVSVSTSTMWNLGVSSYVYTLISLIMVVLVGGIATRKSMVAGVLMFVITILILRAIGWLSVMSDVSIVFVILLCIIGIFVWIKQGGNDASYTDCPFAFVYTGRARVGCWKRYI